MHKTTCVPLEHTRPGKEASPEARQAFGKLLKKQKVRWHPENTCALVLQSWLSEEALLLLLLVHCRGQCCMVQQNAVILHHSVHIC